MDINIITTISSKVRIDTSRMDITCSSSIPKNIKLSKVRTNISLTMLTKQVKPITNQVSTFLCLIVLAELMNGSDLKLDDSSIYGGDDNDKVQICNE